MIKINMADKWFSKCVRRRNNWTCERCNAVYGESYSGLHCSHYFGRRSYSTRYDADNAFAHCYGCHQYLGSNPDLFQIWVKSMLGETRLDQLRQRNRDISLGKSIKKNQKDVAKHYKAQFDWMQTQDDLRIEFINYI
mgnify:FL=1